MSDKIYTAEKFIKSDGTGGFLKSDGTEDNSIYQEDLGYTPENATNKQNSLVPDGQGVKYPTVDAVKASLEMDLPSPSNLSTVTVGGLPAGTNLDGKTFADLFKDMLIVYLNPAFTSASTTYSTPIEVGTIISGNVTFNWATSNSTNVKVNSLSIFDVNTSTSIKTNLANDGNEIAVVNDVILNNLDATQRWKIRGLNTKDIQFESGDITVTAKYRRFFGASGATPTTSAQVRALQTNEFQTANSQTFTLNTGNTHSKFVVALPSPRTILSAINETALSSVVTYLSTGTILVNDAGGTPRTYNLYELNLGAPYSVNQVHKITTS